MQTFISRNNRAFIIGLFLTFLHCAAYSQSYFEDFDKMEVGKGIAAQSLLWLETFGNGRPGQRSSDAKVVDSKSFSGDKALYFVNENGVQADVRLSFGKSYDIGLVDFSMKMYLPMGKTAYFEIRGSQSLSTDLSLVFETNGRGSYTVVDNLGNDLATGSHPVDEWFGLNLKMDLTTNSWGLGVGTSNPQTFFCPMNKAAYIRLVGSDRFGGYHVDDVRYKVTPYDYKDFNVAMFDASYVGGQFSGSPVSITATVRNLGSYEVNVLTLGIIYNDVLYKETIEGLSFFTGNSFTYQFDTTFPAVAGTHYAEILVLDVEGKPDEDESDNVKVIKIRPLEPAQGKKILVESGVSTFCGDCPSAYVIHQMLESSLEGLVVPIQIHKDDPMSPNVSYADFFGNYTLPYSLMHRNEELSSSITSAINQMTKELEREPLATMEIGAVMNQDSSTLTVSVAYAVKQVVEGVGWKVACAWVEDHVTGLESGYNQRNNYWNGALGPMGGYEQLPRIIHGSQMVYEHVLRNYQPSFLGSNELPVGKQLGDSTLFSFSFTRGSTWQLSEGRLVAMLIRPDGSMDNVQDIPIREALARGEIVLGLPTPAQKPAMVIYPNPASDHVNICAPQIYVDAYVTIRNVSGQMVYSAPCAGGIPLAIKTAHWARGMYIVEMGSPGMVNQSRLVLR
ncbi:MAG: Omp28-related outer membrane protein [Bacteroidetes bacterium]|nr:Omp28-related outer membrane protein [Bacteroidota bacterium]